jgi:photosystem II stability/assembly factor-like uncharacterized protein
VLVPNGAGFRDVTPPRRPMQIVDDAFFLDGNHGWVVLLDIGSRGANLLRTSDGGRTWEPTSFESSVSMNAGSGIALDFFDARHGWAVDYAMAAGGGILRRTNDGGRTWSGDRELPILGTVHFVSPTHGWLATGQFGYRGLFESIDGGDTWQRRTLPAPSGVSSEDLVFGLPAFFGRRGVVSAGTRNGSEPLAFYVTTNDGRTWQLAATFEPAADSGPAIVRARSAAVWWAVLNNSSGLFVTTDGGSHWDRRQPHGLSGITGDLAAHDQQRATALTKDDDRFWLSQTQDGGTTWDRREVIAP